MPATRELPDNAAVRACAAGDLDLCYDATEYLKGPGANAAGLALMARWRTGCDNGDGSDCFRSALISNVPIVAIELMDRACVGHIPLACWKIGKAFNDLPDVGDAFDAPVAPLASACNRDDHSACVALGAIYWLGRKDVARDANRAFGYLRIACDRFHDEAACGQLRFLGCKLKGIAVCPTGSRADPSPEPNETPDPPKPDRDDDLSNGVEGGRKRP